MCERSPRGDPMAWPDDTHTRPCQLDPGVYLSMPQGHALVTDGSRYMTVVHLGTAVQLGSVTVEDPDVLVKLADHLVTLADRVRTSSGGTACPDLGGQQ